MEVSRANSFFRVTRETRECRMVTEGRSYAVVAGLRKNQVVNYYNPCTEEAQAGGSNDLNKKSSTRSTDGPKAESKKVKQASVAREEFLMAVGEDKDVDAPTCRSSLSASMLIPKTLPYP